jgi:HemY protein
VIRLLAFTLLLVAASIAAAWFIENDGSVVVEWMGWRIQTSVGFAILLGLILIALCTLVLESVLWIRNLPERYQRKRKERIREKGISALTAGFTAIAAGDAKSARRLTNRAESCLGSLPVTRLLSAQTSQIEGDKEYAKQQFSQMLEHKETEIIAIKGLLLQAREEGDVKKAIFLAEKAAGLTKHADWPIAILLDLYKRTAQWDKLEGVIDSALSKKLLTRKEAMQSLAVCSLAKARELEKQGDYERSLGLAMSALKILPEFVPALVHTARTHIQQKQTKQAIKLIERNWSNLHHADLLSLYLDAHADQTHEKTLQRAENLLEKSVPTAENYTLLARYALKTGQLSKARSFIEQSLSCNETAEACLIMSELLRRENASMDTIHSYENRIHAAPHQPSWHCNCCAHTPDHWEAQCPNCHSFDSLYWGKISHTHVIPAVNAHLLT